MGDCAFWLRCSEHIKNQNWPKVVYLRVATLFDNRIVRPTSEHIRARHSQKNPTRAAGRWRIIRASWISLRLRPPSSALANGTVW